MELIYLWSIQSGPDIQATIFHCKDKKEEKKKLSLENSLKSLYIGSKIIF